MGARRRATQALLAATLLVLVPGGVRADCPPGYPPADLAPEAPDVVLSDAIRTQAAELGYDPVRIYEFVRNEFEYQHYTGLMRGPEGTLQARRGNDYDLAALLVSLLRVSEDRDGDCVLGPSEDDDGDGRLDGGTPARFVRGRIRVPSAEAASWIGTEDGDAAATFFQQLEPPSWASDPSLGTTDDGSHFEALHVWVEAKVRLANYRGAGEVASNRTWVPLDPSFKLQDLQEGIELPIGSGLAFDYADYYSEVKQDFPAEIFRDQVRDHLAGSGDTVGDVPIEGPLVPVRSGVIPTALPYALSSSLDPARDPSLIPLHTHPGKSPSADAGADGADTYRHRIEIRVCSAEDCNGNLVVGIVVDSAAVEGKRVTVSFPPTPGSEADVQAAGGYTSCLPADNVQTQPTIWIDGAPTTGQTQSLCANQHIQIDPRPAFDDYLGAASYELPAGGTYHVAIDTGSSSPATFEALSDELTTELQRISIDPATEEPLVDGGLYETDFQAQEEIAGRFLQLVGLRYFQKLREAEREIRGLHHYLSGHWPYVGLIESRPVVDVFLDAPFMLRPKQLVIDIRGVFQGRFDRSTGEQLEDPDHAFTLLGHHGSALEHGVWEELADAEAMSMVKGFQIRAENGHGTAFVTSTASAAAALSCNHYQPNDLTDYEIFHGGTAPYTCNNVPRWLYCQIRSNWVPRSQTAGSIQVIDAVYPDVSYSFSLDGKRYWKALDWDLYHCGPPGRNQALKGERFVKHSQQSFQYAEWEGSVRFLQWQSGEVGAEQYLINAAFAGPLSGGWLLRYLAGDEFYDPAGNFADFADVISWQLDAYSFLEHDNIRRLNTDRFYTAFFGDPVNVVTGNMNHQVVDLEIPGRGGHDLRLVRTYNSRLGYDGPLGHGWIHTYDQHLRVESDDSEVVWVDEDGGETPFTDPGGAGALTPPGWAFETLVRNGDGSFTLTTTTGMVYQFCSPGDDDDPPCSSIDEEDRASLLSITDRNGNVIAMDYDAGRLIGVIDSAGRRLKLFYDGNGRLERIQDWTGRSWGYEVQGGDLVSYRDPIGMELGNASRDETFEYMSGQSNEDLNHNMVSHTLPATRTGGAGQEVTTWEYYANDTVYRVTNGMGESGTLLYNRFLRRTTVTNPDGVQEDYTYDRLGNITRYENGRGIAREYEYEEGTRHRIGDVDPFGERTEATWDASGNMTSRTDRLDHTESWTYNPFAQPLTHTDKRGLVRAWEYDEDGNVLTERAEVDGAMELLERHAYDEYGNRVETIVYPEKDESAPRRTRFQYAQNGVDLVRQVDALGHETVFEVDALGRTTETRTVRTSADGPQVVRHETVYDALSRPVAEVGPGGLREHTVYDENGAVAARLAFVPAADGSSPAVPTVSECAAMEACRYDTRVEYDAAGRAIRETNALGDVREVEYNVRGWPVRAISPLGHATRYRYDVDGNVIEVIDPTGARTQRFYDAADRLVKEIDALGRVSTASHDEAGRLLEATGPGGRTLKKVTAYDELGNEVLTENAEGVETSRVYDDLGRLRHVTQGVGETDPQGGQMEAHTQLIHDLEGSLVEKIDPEGRSTKLRYDILGRLVEREDPLGRKTVFGYDELGNRLLSVNAAGDEVRYEYDARGLLLRRSADPAAQGLSATESSYAYDGFGRQILAQEGTSVRRTEYDDLDRIVAQTDPRFGVVRRVHDADGRLQQLTYPDGSTSHYTYTPRGQIASIRHAPLAPGGAPGLDWRFSYDALGRPAEREDPFGVIRTVDYTVEGFLDRVELTGATGPLDSFDYEAHDPLGNPGEIQSDEGITRIEYDALSRTTKVAYPGGDLGTCGTGCERFEYDRAGNRTLHQVDGEARHFVVDAADQLQRIEDDQGAALETFEHDAAGRRVSRTTSAGDTTYVYDGLGRLRITYGPGYLNSFQYSANDERIARFGTGGQADYFASFVERRGGVDERLVRGPGTDQVIAQVSAAGPVRTLLRDGRANVTHVAVDGDPEEDGQGSPVPPRRYRAFGELRSGTSDVERGFAGQVKEGPSGLVYMRARHYDPTTGRFLQQDPLGVEADQLYAYAANNPFRFVDPSGLQPKLVSDYFLHAFENLSLGADELSRGEGGCFDARTCGVVTATRTLSQFFLPDFENPLFGSIVAEGILAVPILKPFKVLKALRGGAAAVRVGRSGEDAVRAAYKIGRPRRILTNGRSRVPDGLTDTVLSEVKNVKSLSFSKQLRDYADFAQKTHRQFHLYLRPTTEVSGPLKDAIDSGLIKRFDIPQ